MLSDVGYLGNGMFSTWNVRMWDIGDVRYWGFEMFDVEMLGMWNIW